MWGARAARIRVCGLLRSLNLFEPSCLSGSSRSGSPPVADLLPQAHRSSRDRHYGSVPNRPIRGQRVGDRSEDDFIRSLNFGGNSDRGDRKATGTPPSSSSEVSDSPMRGDKRLGKHFPGDDAKDNVQRSGRGPPLSPPFSRPRREEGRDGVPSRERGNLGGGFSSGRLGSSRQSSPVDLAGWPPGGFERGDRSENFSVGDLKMSGPSEGSLAQGKRGDQPVSSLLQKLRLGRKADEEKAREGQPPIQASETESTLPESSSQDADEIFRKMKETGLIPNAVAMLDGLCKDGLIQEAMKLFGLMREKGTIPEVVIYTAVVEGFCRASKFDDAKRVFRKMQSNGVSPNAFSYKVLIEGLSKGKRLEDSVDFCLEMLDAGHSPSVVTFTGLVDELCKEKGVDDAESVVRRLRERGFAIDEKAVREHLDKKGPFSPTVWEAILGKKVSKRPF